MKSRLIAESFPVFVGYPGFPSAISNGPAVLDPDDDDGGNNGGGGGKKPDVDKRDTDNGGSYPLSPSAPPSSLTATTLRTSSVTSALSEPTLPLKKPCNDGEWYDELLGCMERCSAGTCTSFSERFRRDCEGCHDGPQIAYRCTC